MGLQERGSLERRKVAALYGDTHLRGGQDDFKDWGATTPALVTMITAFGVFAVDHPDGIGFFFADTCLLDLATDVAIQGLRVFAVRAQRTNQTLGKEAP